MTDFFGGMAGPLGDDLGVGVGHVGIGLDGQAMERDDPPEEQQHAKREHSNAVAQGKVD
jgi:hypothetical protein